MCTVKQNFVLFNFYAWTCLKPGIIFDWDICIMHRGLLLSFTRLFALIVRQYFNKSLNVKFTFYNQRYLISGKCVAYFT